MSNNYTETELQLILNKITSAQANTITMNEGELYLAPDNAVYSVNNITPTNGNVSIPEGANKDLSNLSSTGNSKFQAPITGGASTITSSNLTTNRALVSNSSGKVAVSSVTLSELGYVSGVTSNIQTQLNNKVASVNNIQPVNGNVTIPTGSSLPDQTGHSGDILTTDGTDASWADTVQVYPVVETYRNGTSWYRVYSDGWCEQGGKLDVAQAAEGVLITLLKPYRDTVYYPIVCITDWAAAWSAEANARAIVSTNASFSIQSGGNRNPSNMMWQACGYIN